MKLVSFFLLAGLFLGIVACSNQKSPAEKQPDSNEYQSENNVAEEVYKHLPKSDKQRINGSWKEGKVSQVTIKKEMVSQLKDKSYEGKEVYLIRFPTKGTAEPDMMAVYADTDTFKTIGYALVQ